MSKVELIKEEKCKISINEKIEIETDGKQKKVYFVEQNLGNELDLVFETVNKFGFIITEYHTFPESLRFLVSHGGDEDYIILSKVQNYRINQIVDNLTICGSKEVVLFYEGQKYKLVSTSHA